VRFLPMLAAALAAASVAAAPAAADSIVYAKGGNLFLTSPDGSKGYQLTRDGGYSEPSQADTGTVGALRYDELVRLDRSGRLLNAPIKAMGSDDRAIGGPYEPRISPDGTRFAYYFYVQSSYDDLEHDHIRWINTGSYGTWTYADHFTSPAIESEYERSLTQTEWVTNDRLLGTQGMFMNMWTWKLGTGHDYTSSAAQWWFGLQDPVDDWGVAAYHWYDDPALSRDGAHVAMTDAAGLYVAATNGPAWSGEPPYPEPDYVNPDSGFAKPTIPCSVPVKAVNPSWSPDGGTLAYTAPDGLHVMRPDCTGDRLLAPGATGAAFGPADLPASAPAPSPSPSLSGLSPRPAKFKARRGTTVRFTLSAPARVTLSVRRIKRTVNGRAGLNRVRFKPRLKPGGYRLSAGGASARFRVVR
jgi:WD40-like Beta Propeller Repeat